MTTVTSATSTAQTGSTAQNSSSSPAASTGMVDYNSFLKILITELQNQDPTSPSDPTQYVSQLASFSGVEQQINTNSKLSAMLSSLGLGQAGSVIGHTISSSDGTTSGNVVSVSITSSGATATLDSGQQLTLGPGIIVS